MSNVSPIPAPTETGQISTFPNQSTATPTSAKKTGATGSGVTSGVDEREAIGIFSRAQTVILGASVVLWVFGWL